MPQLYSHSIYQADQVEHLSIKLEEFLYDWLGSLHFPDLECLLGQILNCARQIAVKAVPPGSTGTECKALAAKLDQSLKASSPKIIDEANRLLEACEETINGAVIDPERAEYFIAEVALAITSTACPVLKAGADTSAA